VQPAGHGGIWNCGSYRWCVCQHVLLQGANYVVRQDLERRAGSHRFALSQRGADLLCCSVLEWLEDRPHCQWQVPLLPVFRVLTLLWMLWGEKSKDDGRGSVCKARMRRKIITTMWISLWTVTIDLNWGSEMTGACGTGYLHEVKFYRECGTWTCRKRYRWVIVKEVEGDLLYDPPLVFHAIELKKLSTRPTVLEFSRV